jgi:alpha-beta hydrolase superfamily lysophospholipase
LLLRTTTSYPPLDAYAALAFVAHSMGGLVVQRALLDKALTSRVSHRGV